MLCHVNKFKPTLDELKSKMGRITLAPPPATTISYATGLEAFDRITTRKNGEKLKCNKNKQDVKRYWKECIGDSVFTITNGDYSAFWDYMFQHCKQVESPASSKSTRIGNLKRITNALHLPNGEIFETYANQIRAEVKAERMKPYDVPTLKKKLMCKGTGKMLTTAKLCAECKDVPHCGAALLYLWSTHGNRLQDWWNVGANKPSQTKYGYLEGDTLHLNDGKTMKEGDPPRTVSLGTSECTALRLFLEGKGNRTDSKWARTQMKKHCEEAGYPYLPPTELRALYEFNIRFVEKKPTYQIRKEMKEIGHSMKTGIEEYGWRFSNLAQLMKDEPELFD